MFTTIITSNITMQVSTLEDLVTFHMLDNEQAALFNKTPMTSSFLKLCHHHLCVIAGQYISSSNKEDCLNHFVEIMQNNGINKQEIEELIQSVIGFASLDSFKLGLKKKNKGLPFDENSKRELIDQLSDIKIWPAILAMLINATKTDLSHLKMEQLISYLEMNGIIFHHLLTKMIAWQELRQKKQIDLKNITEMFKQDFSALMDLNIDPLILEAFQKILVKYFPIISRTPQKERENHPVPEISAYKKMVHEIQQAMTEKHKQEVIEKLNQENAYLHLFQSEDFDPQEFKERLNTLGLTDISNLMHHFIRLRYLINFDQENLEITLYELTLKIDLPAPSIFVFDQMLEAFQEKILADALPSELFSQARRRLDFVLRLPNLQYNQINQNPMQTLQALMALYASIKGNQDRDPFIILQIAFLVFLLPPSCAILTSSPIFDQLKSELKPIFTHLELSECLLDYLVVCNHFYKINRMLENYFTIRPADSETKMAESLSEIETLLKKWGTLFEEDRKRELLHLFYPIDNLITYHASQSQQSLPLVMEKLREIGNQIKTDLAPQTNKRHVSEMQSTDQNGKGKEKEKEKSKKKKHHHFFPSSSQDQAVSTQEKKSEHLPPSNPDCHSTNLPSPPKS